MLTPALRLDMASESTSMACDMPHPIVALAILALPVVALPIIALRVSSSTLLRYQHCGIWSKTAGPVEEGFEGQEVGDDTRHCVCLLSEHENGCKSSPFFGIREDGHDVEFLPRVLDRDVAYSKIIDYLVLS